MEKDEILTLFTFKKCFMLFVLSLCHRKPVGDRILKWAYCSFGKQAWICFTSPVAFLMFKKILYSLILMLSKFRITHYSLESNLNVIIKCERTTDTKPGNSALIKFWYSLIQYGSQPPEHNELLKLNFPCGDREKSGAEK